MLLLKTLRSPSLRASGFRYIPISTFPLAHTHLFEHSPTTTSIQFRREFTVSRPPVRQPHQDAERTDKLQHSKEPVLKDTIYTFPNVLTLSRIISCPILGYAILHDNFCLATSLLVYAGLTDLADGYLARKFNMCSVVGTILDPAADKILMTTLVVTLTMRDMVPLPLGIIILSRDLILSLWAFYIRFTTLPPPKTFQRYWDFSIPSAKVFPTTISKVNTALQLLLMGVTTVMPLLSTDISVPLQGLQWTVAATTLWSGFSYLFTKGGFKVIKAASNKTPPTSPPHLS